MFECAENTPQPDQCVSIMNWLDALTVGQVVSGAAIVVAIVVAVWKGSPLARRIIELLAASIKLVDTLATLPEDMAAIRHELERNGGGSLKDSVVRIEQRVEELSSDVGHVKRQNASLKTSVARTKRTIEEHVASSGGRDA